MFMKKAGALWLSAILILAGGIRPAMAEGISLVRDAETENMLQEYSTPIWRAAGLTPSSIHIYLVNDNSINAFVAAGQRLFVNTGLITQADSPNELIGVIAHETGHMAGGHLVRSQEAMSGMRLPMIASMVLGIGAMAAGAGDAGMAIIAGGSQIAQRSMLSYSREQESRADQAGATYLERSGTSGKGMLDLFSKFRDQEALTSTQQDPFVRSHPISEDRLSGLEERVKTSPFFDRTDTPERVHQLKMVQAKLFGFMDEPDVTFRRYPASDQSDYAHYARSVAYHKSGQNDQSLAELESLLNKDAKNPYLWELKGQILFEGGRAAEAIPAYRKALALLPREPQLQLALGQALLAVEKPEFDREALGHLQDAAKGDPENPFSFYQLSIAYGRANNIGMAELSTAEYYAAVGSMPDARGHAERAQKLLKKGSPEWLKAQDIMQEEG